MNAGYFKEVIRLYRSKLEEGGYGKEEWRGDRPFSSGTIMMCHCRWMLDEMEKQIDAGDMEKASRWLCFIQGAISLHWDFSIKDFRDQLRGILKG